VTTIILLGISFNLAFTLAGIQAMEELQELYHTKDRD